MANNELPDEYIKRAVEESDVLGKPMEEWLKEYSKKSAIYSNRKKLEDFLKWCNKTDVELVSSYKQAEDKEAEEKATH